MADFDRIHWPICSRTGGRFAPESLADLHRIMHANEFQRAWELAGLYYYNHSRFYDAIAIFNALYKQMFLAQKLQTNRVMKGMPLVFISDCFRYLGFPALAKRFMMLTLCEDSIGYKGPPSPTSSGSYFRLILYYGLSDKQLKKYANEIYAFDKEFPSEAIFPEWILQHLDQDWMIEYPTPQEASIYYANSYYIDYLISKMGSGDGRNLELLAQYLLSCMPGCRTYRRSKSKSTDYDIVCNIDGFDIDFRSELGRYFVCECKDWSFPADFTTMAKFCRVLDSTKSKFGILFSREGISGAEKNINAEREQLKVFQDRGMVIVVIDQNDLNTIAEGENFINLLRRKYEKVRLDLL